MKNVAIIIRSTYVSAVSRPKVESHVLGYL